MQVSEFKHLNKEQLKRRVKILNSVVYIGIAIGIGSYIFFFTTLRDPDWLWLLIAATYTLFPINLIQQKRRMTEEIRFREERYQKVQEAPDTSP